MTVIAYLYGFDDNLVAGPIAIPEFKFFVTRCRRRPIAEALEDHIDLPLLIEEYQAEGPPVDGVAFYHRTR